MNLCSAHSQPNNVCALAKLSSSSRTVCDTFSGFDVDAKSHIINIELIDSVIRNLKRGRHCCWSDGLSAESWSRKKNNFIASFMLSITGLRMLMLLGLCAHSCWSRYVFLWWLRFIVNKVGHIYRARQ